MVWLQVLKLDNHSGLCLSFNSLSVTTELGHWNEIKVKYLSYNCRYTVCGRWYIVCHYGYANCWYGQRMLLYIILVDKREIRKSLWTSGIESKVVWSRGICTDRTNDFSRQNLMLLNMVAKTLVDIFAWNDTHITYFQTAKYFKFGHWY